MADPLTTDEAWEELKPVLQALGVPSEVIKHCSGFTVSGYARKQLEVEIRYCPRKPNSSEPLIENGNFVTLTKKYKLVENK